MGDRWRELRRSPERLLFLACFLSIGLGGLVLAVWTFWAGWSSTQWPHVPGQVVRSQMAHASGMKGTSSQSTSSLYADITYTYTVDNVDYTSSKTDSGGWSRQQTEVAQQLRAHPVGGTQVYYNPEEPSEAVLAPGVHWQSVGLSLVFGFVFAGFGGGLAFAAKS